MKSPVGTLKKKKVGEKTSYDGDSKAIYGGYNSIYISWGPTLYLTHEGNMILPLSPPKKT